MQFYTPLEEKKSLKRVRTDEDDDVKKILKNFGIYNKKEIFKIVVKEEEICEEEISKRIEEYEKEEEIRKEEEISKRIEEYEKEEERDKKYYEIFKNGECIL
jgi:hypothetical protein